MAAMAAAAARSRAGRPSYVAYGANFRHAAGEDLGAIIFHRCEGMAKSIGFETESFAANSARAFKKAFSPCGNRQEPPRRPQVENVDMNDVCTREVGRGIRE